MVQKMVGLKESCWVDSMGHSKVDNWADQKVVTLACWWGTHLAGQRVGQRAGWRVVMWADR